MDRSNWDRRREWRKQRKEELKSRDVKLARKRWIWCVRITAIPMPAWCQKRRIKGLSFTDSLVWLKPRDAQFLIARDQECGGSPVFAETEYRKCPVCGRPLISEDAKLRRMLDESGMTGRQKPCGSECLEGARDKRWVA
jgi:hypothetical protein